MVLETERLILDTWQVSDRVAFQPIATDVEVMRYITGGVPWNGRAGPVLRGPSGQAI